MKHIFSKYKIQLIKEEGKKYDVPNYITSPEEIEKVAKYVLQLDKECEEVFCILALDNKNKVIGTFEVARGSICSAIVTQREVAKRLILLNAVKFVSAHNHPSGDTTPSQADIDVSSALSVLGRLIGIEHLDFVIVGDDLLSFRSKELL